MANIISSSVSTTTLPTRRHEERADAPIQQAVESAELNRLICAAVVSRKFCAQLLRSPEVAIEAGYNGEKFNLSPAEHDFVVSCGATSLAELAQQVAQAGH